MKIRISDLWRWDGTVDRGPYVLIGVLLFALKHNLDRLTASLAFNQKWSLFNYLIPSEKAINITTLTRDEQAFYGTLLATALPFIYTGVVLTLRRLRAVGLPAWLVVFFFAPLLNLIFFLILGILPTRADGTEKFSMHQGRLDRLLARVIPNNVFGSAAMAVLIVVPLTAAASWMSVSFFSKYGWALFVGLPFTLGFASVLLYSYHEQRSFGGCVLVALLAVAVLGFALVALAIEGVLCIAMAAPLGGVLAFIGAVVGYFIQLRPRGYGEAARVLSVLLVFMPALMGAETKSDVGPPLIAVRTSVEIDAPPERVWKHVVSFSELPPPDNWLFEIGVAYPMRAEIQGHGVGAVRHCVFSTGPFVEPIEAWDEPRLLKFSVTAQPPAMREWSPYDIHPPHIDHYLISRGGQFLLTPLPGGRTRLEGTTWYEHKIWPVTYWRVWSDAIIHRIHMRVLNHVRNLSENRDSGFAAEAGGRDEG